MECPAAFLDTHPHTGPPVCDERKEKTVADTTKTTKTTTTAEKTALEPKPETDKKPDNKQPETVYWGKDEEGNWFMTNPTSPHAKEHRRKQDSEETKK